MSSLEPKLSRLLELRVVEAKSRLWLATKSGGERQLAAAAKQQQQPPSDSFDHEPAQVLHAKLGDQLNISCRIEAPDPTANVYWYKNKEVVRFDIFQQPRASEPAPSDFDAASAGPGEPRMHSASSWLAIKSVQASDAGSYKCKVSFAPRNQKSQSPAAD